MEKTKLIQLSTEIIEEIVHAHCLRESKPQPRRIKNKLILMQYKIPTLGNSIVEINAMKLVPKKNHNVDINRTPKGVFCSCLLFIDNLVFFFLVPTDK